MDVVVEKGFFRIKKVFAPVGRQDVVSVDEATALEKVAYVVKAVIVEAVGVERGFAVLHYDVVAYLREPRVPVIKKIVAR